MPKDLKDTITLKVTQNHPKIVSATCDEDGIATIKLSYPKEIPKNPLSGKPYFKVTQDPWAINKYTDK